MNDKELHMQTFENSLQNILNFIQDIEFVNLDKLYAEYSMRCWYRSRFVVLCGDRSTSFDVVADQDTLPPQLVLTANQLADIKIWRRAIPFCKHSFINRLNGFIGDDEVCNELSPNSIIVKMIPIWLPVVTVIRPENSGYPETLVIEVAECVFFYVPDPAKNGKELPSDIPDNIVGPFAIGSRVNIRMHSTLRRELKDLMLYSVISRILYKYYRAKHEESTEEQERVAYAKTKYTARKTISRDGLTLLYTRGNIVYVALQSSKPVSSTRLREKIMSFVDIPAYIYSNPSGYRKYELEQLIDILTFAAIRFKQKTGETIQRDPTNIDVINGPLAYDTLVAILKGFAINALQKLRTGPLWYLFCNDGGWSVEEAEKSLSADTPTNQLLNSGLLV